VFRRFGYKLNTESLSVSLSAMYLLTSDEKVVPCTLDAGNDLIFVRFVDLPTTDDFDFSSIVDRDGEEYHIDEWFIQRKTRRCIVLCIISDFFTDEEEDDETCSDDEECSEEGSEVYFPPSEAGSEDDDNPLGYTPSEAEYEYGFYQSLQEDYDGTLSQLSSASSSEYWDAYH